MQLTLDENIFKAVGLTVISEASLYTFFLYAQWLMDVNERLISAGGIFLSSFILLALLNLSLFTCPIIRKYWKVAKENARVDIKVSHPNK